MKFWASRYIVATLVCVACNQPAAVPLTGPGPREALAKGGGSTNGDALVADALAGDFASASSHVIVSSCAGDVSKSYGVDFGAGAAACLTLTPTGSSYLLADDIIILPRTSRGVITEVRLWGQDVVGADGIMHDTDPIRVATPVAASPSGFTLHVHADNVPVYRLSGHTGGPRVRMIGTIAIGDIVFRLP